MTDDDDWHCRFCGYPIVPTPIRVNRRTGRRYYVCYNTERHRESWEQGPRPGCLQLFRLDAPWMLAIIVVSLLVGVWAFVDALFDFVDSLLDREGLEASLRRSGVYFAVTFVGLLVVRVAVWLLGGRGSCGGCGRGCLTGGEGSVRRMRSCRVVSVRIEAHLFDRSATSRPNGP